MRQNHLVVPRARADWKSLRSVASVGNRSTGPVYLAVSWDFRIRSTESIVFQLRVVAGAPKSLSDLAEIANRFHVAAVHPINIDIGSHLIQRGSVRSFP